MRRKNRKITNERADTPADQAGVFFYLFVRCGKNQEQVLNKKILPVKLFFFGIRLISRKEPFNTKKESAVYRMKKEKIVEETLIKNYEKYYRLAYSYVRNEADAQDIVQDGAYKAILKCDTLQKPEYADTWIYRIMIREAISFLKKNQTAPVSVEEVEEAVPDQYADVDLRRAVASLDPVDRTVVILRYFEDLKFQQIATAINENQNTVKTRLYRALRKLGVILSDEKEFSGR